MFKSGKKLSLTVQIFVSLVLGVIAGLLLQGHASFASTYIKPFGTIYLNLIKMVVVPVVLLSIIQGIISLQDVRRVGTIGVRTLIYFVCTTAVAVALGLILANVLQVGAGYQFATENLSYEAAAAPSFIDLRLSQPKKASSAIVFTPLPVSISTRERHL